MNIKEMHYDFKRKYNKTDSQQNRNLLVPEIDQYLNEAEEIFKKTVAEPRFKTRLGFESSQRNIDSIRSIVETDCYEIEDDNLYILPDNYQYYVRGRLTIDKGQCIAKKAVLTIQEHDDEFEEDVYTKSSFEWKRVNGLFNSEGIQLFTDGTFTIKNVCITYIRQTSFMHNAEAFRAGGYLLPSGVALTGFVNCELPENTHREIVDIAVMLAAGEIQASDFQLKLNKLNLNQII
jgi:hypothetical protein